jgi:hypothetical protein
VRNIEHLRKNLEENYNVYMARTILNNYLLPKQANSIAVASRDFQSLIPNYYSNLSQSILSHSLLLMGILKKRI